MKQMFDFNELTTLCFSTHEKMQQRAVYTVNISLVIRNWLFGCYISDFEQKGENRAGYGKNLIKKLSDTLQQQGIKGVSATNLKQCRSFYLSYQTISQTLSDQSLSIHSERANFLEQASDLLMPEFSLSWSHYITLLMLDNPNERRFYELESSANSWSVRELERQISSSLYERLALSRSKEEVIKLSEQGLIVEKAADLIKNPFVLEFLGLEEKPTYSENDLEQAIITKLESFLLELGKGFLFEARQKRFTFDNDHFYVDLVFYNRLLHCYVLIDLKRDKLTHQDLGQMQMYVNYFDRHVKTADEAPTIGIVLCHRKNDALVELTLPEENNIYASRYQLYLPSKEELKAELQKIESELSDH